MGFKSWFFLFFLGLAVASLPAAPQAGEGAAPDSVDGDQETLRNASVATDPAGLVAYLRKSVLSDADRGKIEGLVQQLGSDRFAAREEATDKLVAIGSPAVPFLCAAARSANREVAGRAEFCLSEIEHLPDSSIPAAAVRLLARRPNGDALQTLLDFFPFAGDEGVEEEVIVALGMLGVKHGKPEPLLAAALKDPLPARRGAAACALARAGEQEQRGTVRQMLADPDARVRYFVGKGLLGDRYPKPETPLNVEDKKFVKSANVGSDAAGLIAFLKKRTLSDEDRKNLESMVKQLDSSEFAQRQEASRRLVEIGTPALPFLRTAAVGSSLEMTRRVEECIKQIERGPGPALPSAATRLLAQRAPAEAVQVLIDYVPFADDASVEDEVIAALGVLSTLEPKVPAALPATLKDKLPARRAAAVLVLGQVGAREHFEAVRELLADADARVRLRAAQGLVAAKDKIAVPVLLALLGEGPVPQATAAESLLQNIAGEKAPALTISDAGEDVRKKAHESWMAWWRENGDKLDLGATPQGRPFLGLTLVTQLNAPMGAKGTLSVWEYGPDGKNRWEMTANFRGGAIDARLLPGNRILVAEYNDLRVTERDMTGKILWEKRTPGNPVSCQRLANGNTFIGTYTNVLEITPAGKEVYNHGVAGGNVDAFKMRNGNIMCLTNNATTVLEIDTAGKQVRRTQVVVNGGGWGALEELPGGRALVAEWTGKVVEIDAQGKTLWQCNVPGATHAIRLRNGNTLVACANIRKLIEVDRGGKTVSEKTTTGRPFHMRQR